MFDIDAEKLALVGLVALVVIGPKDLPRVMRVVGRWVGQARRMAGHFRSGIDEMIRQSEIEEMEKKWAEENARIMREHPLIEPPKPEAENAAPVMRPLAAPAAEAEAPAPDKPA
jgi:sec-independent protein translocase protein TatB